MNDFKVGDYVQCIDKEQCIIFHCEEDQNLNYNLFEEKGYIEKIVGDFVVVNFKNYTRIFDGHTHIFERASVFLSPKQLIKLEKINESHN